MTNNNNYFSLFFAPDKNPFVTKDEPKSNAPEPDKKKETKEDIGPFLKKHRIEAFMLSNNNTNNNNNSTGFKFTNNNKTNNDDTSTGFKFTFASATDQRFGPPYVFKAPTVSRTRNPVQRVEIEKADDFGQERSGTKNHSAWGNKSKLRGANQSLIRKHIVQTKEKIQFGLDSLQKLAATSIADFIQEENPRFLGLFPDGFGPLDLDDHIALKIWNILQQRNAISMSCLKTFQNYPNLVTNADIVGKEWDKNADLWQYLLTEKLTKIAELNVNQSHMLRIPAHMHNMITLRLVNNFWLSEYEGLRDCKNLTTLNLSGCPVTCPDLEHIAEITSLTALNLSSTLICDFGIPVLQKLVNLRVLRVNESGVSEKGKLQLTKQLPQIQKEELPEFLLPVIPNNRLGGYDISEFALGGGDFDNLYREVTYATKSWPCNRCQMLSPPPLSENCGPATLAHLCIHTLSQEEIGKAEFEMLPPHLQQELFELSCEKPTLSTEAFFDYCSDTTKKLNLGRKSRLSPRVFEHVATAIHSLVWLSFAENRTVSVLQMHATIVHNPHLQFVDLSHTNANQPVIDAVAKCSQLQTLLLNGVAWPWLDPIAECITLKKLSVVGNLHMDSFWYAAAPQPELEELIVTTCDLQAAVFRLTVDPFTKREKKPLMLQRFPNLKRLISRGTVYAQTIDLDCLLGPHLSQIEVLDLGSKVNCQLTQVNQMLQNVNIVRLDLQILGKNEAVQDIVENLPALSNLKILSLPAVTITEKITGHLACSLQALICKNTELNVPKEFDSKHKSTLAQFKFVGGMDRVNPEFIRLVSATLQKLHVDTSDSSRRHAEDLKVVIRTLESHCRSLCKLVLVGNSEILSVQPVLATNPRIAELKLRNVTISRSIFDQVIAYVPRLRHLEISCMTLEARDILQLALTCSYLQVFTFRECQGISARVLSLLVNAFFSLYRINFFQCSPLPPDTFAQSLQSPMIIHVK